MRGAVLRLAMASGLAAALCAADASGAANSTPAGTRAGPPGRRAQEACTQCVFSWGGNTFGQLGVGPPGGADADGWTVILKTNGDDTFQYDSSYWTSTANVLNEDSDPYAPGNAKYSEYNTMRFTEVRACVDTLDNCLDGHTFAEPYANAAQLFGGGHQREGIDQAEFESVFGVSGNQNCGMQRPGFNTQCRGGNWARWGFCNNLPNQGCQTNDNNDADGVIGFGVTGQDCCPLGAGWTVR